MERENHGIYPVDESDDISTHISLNIHHILKMTCSKGANYIRRNNVFNLGYHIIFCPKYRKPYLLRFESLLRTSILKTSIKFQFLIAEIDIMPDHIHLFIKCKNTTTPISKIVGHLKGFSSYSIRKKIPQLKKYKAFWSNRCKHTLLCRIYWKYV